MVEEVRAYYNKNARLEQKRLEHPYGRIEFATTLYLLECYFPKSGHLLDIGCGTGTYALELLKRGYKVSLLDIAEEELALAKEALAKANHRAQNYYCQSATDLKNLPDESFEGLLLLGPMYHLPEKKDRERVLKEAYRVLKQKGVALISYINTWGVLRASIGEFPEGFSDPSHFERYRRGDLAFSSKESFTVTFFTTPPLAKEEVQSLNWKLLSIAGAESFLAGQRNEVARLKENHPEIYENYLRAAPTMAEFPPYRDSTEHMLFCMEK